MCRILPCYIAHRRTINKRFSDNLRIQITRPASRPPRADQRVNVIEPSIEKRFENYISGRNLKSRSEKRK